MFGNHTHQALPCSCRACWRMLIMISHVRSDNITWNEVHHGILFNRTSGCRRSMIPDSGIMFWLVKCLHVDRFAASKIYACDPLQKEKLHSKYRAFLTLSCDKPRSHSQNDWLINRRSRHSIIITLLPKAWYKFENQWIYAKNSCCVQLSLVLREPLLYGDTRCTVVSLLHGF